MGRKWGEVNTVEVERGKRRPELALRRMSFLMGVWVGVMAFL